MEQEKQRANHISFERPHERLSIEEDRKIAL